jgi:hypothetical protein
MPADVRRVDGELADGLPRRVVAVDPEAGGLALQGPGLVAAVARALRARLDHLRADEERLRAIADARDANRGVDRG